jgi:flagellar FliJ protein
MKSIRTIIKLHKQELDAMRQQLAAMQRQKEELLKYSEEMEAELKLEEEFAANNPMMSGTFDQYRKKIKLRQANLAYAIADIDRQIEYITNEIAEKFTEIKKYEIILQQKIAERLQKEMVLESKMLDEVAMNSHLQKADEP